MSNCQRGHYAPVEFPVIWDVLTDMWHHSNGLSTALRRVHYNRWERTSCGIQGYVSNCSYTAQHISRQAEKISNQRESIIFPNVAKK